MATYGGLVKLGTLRNKTTVIPRPTNPWAGNLFPGYGEGNIANFSRDPVITNWNIGDTDSNPDNQLHWHKIRDGSSTLLICDRVILTWISWSDLSSDNRVYGKTITIDGNKYKLRLLSGGSGQRPMGGEWLGGFPENNEWDRFIVNEDKISNLPSPVPSDLEEGMNHTKRNGNHNYVWNWIGVSSWVKETTSQDLNNRAKRGYSTPRRWTPEAFWAKGDWIGWRPVLEVLNQSPTLVLTSPPNNQTLTENTTVNIQGTASDTDKDNVVTIKYRINNNTTRALQSG
ncbi:Ig-like domain-containing protein, partial [Brevibacillus laterosporus]